MSSTSQTQASLIKRKVRRELGPEPENFTFTSALLPVFDATEKTNLSGKMRFRQTLHHAIRGAFPCAAARRPRPAPDPIVQSDQHRILVCSSVETGPSLKIKRPVLDCFPSLFEIICQQAACGVSLRRFRRKMASSHQCNRR